MLVTSFVECFLYYIDIKKTRKYCIAIAGIFGILAFGAKFLGWSTVKKIIVFTWDHLYSDYMVIFITAFIISKYGIFEWIDRKLKLKWVVPTIGIVLAILFRWFYVTDPAQHNCDKFLIPILIFSTVCLLHKASSNSRVVSVFFYLGKYSTFMWLTHTFWIYFYFQKIVLIPRYSVLIFIWATIIALGNGIVFTYLYDFSNKMILTIKNKIKKDKVI